MTASVGGGVPQSDLRVVYVTASLPYGIGERFVVPEVDELRRQGCDVVICPRKWMAPRADSDTRHLLATTLEPRLLSPAIAAAALRECVRSPARVTRAIRHLRASRSRGILLKNLAMVPKALWLARYARTHRVGHIHAHWSATTATLALVAGEVAGIPFSFTAHRWDIAEDNLLAVKVRAAAFSRAIGAAGAADLALRAGVPEDAIDVIRMGVAIGDAGPRALNQPPVIVMPANLLPVKGHAYLLHAVALLIQRGVDLRLEIAGTGPEREAIERDIQTRSLGQHVRLRGFVPHDELLEQLGAGRYDIVVLPSVITPDGEHEGIPVALIEALAAGVPAVGTATGSIAELLGDGAGVLVPERDAGAIADAIERLIGDAEHRQSVVARGLERARSDYSIVVVCAELARRFGQAATA